MVEGKALTCIFWDDVTCQHRKSETAMIMVRCWSCREFKRFVRQLDEADVKMMDDIEKKRLEGDGFG